MKSLKNDKKTNVAKNLRRKVRDAARELGAVAQILYDLGKPVLFLTLNETRARSRLSGSQ